MARRTQGTGVTVNAADPGHVQTNLRVPFPYGIFSFMRGAAVDGAGPALASSSEVDGVRGRYFSRKGEVPSSKASYDEAAARLSAASAQLTHLDAGR